MYNLEKYCADDNGCCVFCWYFICNLKYSAKKDESQIFGLAEKQCKCDLHITRPIRHANELVEYFISNNYHLILIGFQDFSDLRQTSKLNQTPRKIKSYLKVP
jgi:hypothetical protein